MEIFLKIRHILHKMSKRKNILTVTTKIYPEKNEKISHQCQQVITLSHVSSEYQFQAWPA